MDKRRCDYDAVILAGGRSSRLGGVPKQTLLFQGATLLQRSLAAASGAGRTVVVGDTSSLPAATLPPGVLACREEPVFAGPAAAIAAGLDALSHAGAAAPYLLVLACDMPLVSQAVPVLHAALLAAGGGAGVMACGPDGRAQPLAGLYSTGRLREAARDLAARGALVNGSVRALLASLDVQLVTVPAGTTSDVDTWDDAAALGIAAKDPAETKTGAGGANVGGNS
ncbi:MAG: NTP transferase domain-containing protein [Pseudarthrobacter sp.]|nr:NTP transferase domain-containing protein [Pseudarthrobacter sp.]